MLIKPLQPFPRPLRFRDICHTQSLKYTRPSTWRRRVRMLEMLAEMIRPVKLLRRITLPQLVNLSDVVEPLGPILLAGASARAVFSAASEVLPAVPACVGHARVVDALLEDARVAPAWYVRARPGVPPHVEAVFVSFGFVLRLESITAVAALVSSFCFVSTTGRSVLV